MANGSPSNLPAGFQLDIPEGFQLDAPRETFGPEETRVREELGRDTGFDLGRALTGIGRRITGQTPAGDIELARLRDTAPKNTLFARDLPEIGEAPELREFSLQSAKSGLAAGLITNEAELANALVNNIPGSQISQDPEGKALITFPSGGTFAINKPGFSGQDFVQFATRALSFIPASRITGATAGQLARGAVAAGATEAALQGGEAALGGEFSPGQVAVAGVAAPIGQAVGERLLRPAAQQTIKSFKEIGAKKLLEEAAPTTDTLRNSARVIYDQIDNSGAIIKPNLYRRLQKQTQDRMIKEGLDLTERVGDSGTPQALALLNRIQRESPAEMTISRLDALRKFAQGVASSSNSTEANIGRAAIDQIDTMIENLGVKSFTNANNITISGKAVGEAFRDARNFWGRAKRAEEVELAIDLARNARSGFENGLRQQFNSLVKRIKKGQLRGFSREEIAAIDAVAQGDRLRNVVTQLGKLGIPEDQATNTLILTLIGGAGVAGGLPAAVAVSAVAIPTVLRRQARVLTERSARLSSAIVRAKGNAMQIARAYTANTPKSQRNPGDLAALLLNSADKLPETPVENALVDNAIFLARSAFTAEQAEDE